MRNCLLVLLLAALLAACGGPSGDAADDATDEPTVEAITDEPAATTVPADTDMAATATDAAATGGAATDAAASGAATVATADSDLGVILVDADGRSLYLFTNDGEGAGSTCTGDCAENWPAFVTEGDPSAEGDADASLLGTIDREDGATQVTYAGHPLYYFAADSAPGDINGHEVGDVWYLVTPEGEQAGEETAAADDSY